MSFTLDPAVPADSETPRNGASRIRSLTAEVLELFGETGSASETYTLAPIASVDKTTGLATVQGVPTTSLGIATKGYVDASTPSNVFVGSAGGTANVITSTLAPVPSSQAALAGFVIHLRIASTNTGPVTFNPNAFGALAIVKNGNVALVGGELLAGAWADLVYDTTNTNYQIIGLTPGATALIIPQLKAYKPADQTVTSSVTLVNDADLTFAIAANEFWQFEIDLYATFDTAANSGIKAAVTVPSGCTLQWSEAGAPTAVQVTSGTGQQLAPGGIGSSGKYLTKIIGQALNGATPGSVTLQWAQQTSNGTATTAKKGSSLVATRLAP